MNTFTKRGLTLLLALVMCLGTLSGLTFAAEAVEVSYETDTVGSYKNIIKNWGEREVTATYLSPNAEAFYTNNGTSYDLLSQYPGASTTGSVPTSALYTQLQTLMESNHTTYPSYDDTKNLYCYTDCESNDLNTMSSFYSGILIGPAWDGGVTWNREHTWPQSKSLSSTGKDDLMLLRPASTAENGSHNNTAFGESSGYFTPEAFSYDGYDIRGDIARTYLYVYVRWGDSSNAAEWESGVWESNGVIESVDILLKWLEEDPVDTWEMARNDSVESITGTRNVFVDYPELGFLLFNEEIPADLVSPSGEGYRSNYTISAVSSNAAYGTVTLTGNVIAAYPAEGYHAVGYTVTDGSASVSQEGNIFTVIPSANCTVQIEFSDRTPSTVSFMQDRKTIDSYSKFVDDSITLPAHSGSVPDGFYFLGWLTDDLTETTSIPSVLYTAGSSYTVTGDVTFRALYARTDGSGSSTGEEFSRYSGALTEGDYIIVYNGGAMQNTVSSSRLTYRDDFSAIDDIIFAPNESIVWSISIDGSSCTIFSNAIGKYAAGTSANNKAALLTSVTDYASWSYSGSSTYEFINGGNGRYLRRNGIYGFACYDSSTGGALTLYKRTGRTVYYTTYTDSCPHSDAVSVAASAPTCTEDGYTAGVYCNGCQSYLSGHEIINATGHSYESVVTKPTETEQGYTTYTCTVCSDSYVGDYTEATGEIFTVSFWVPDGVANVAAMECGKDGITLPSATAPDGYSFAGWALESVEDTETAPTIYAANSTYTVKENTDLYAVYTYVTDGTGNSQYVKVTEAPADWSGEYLIVYEAGGLIFDGSLEKLDAVSNYQAVTITDNTIPAEKNTAYQFIIAKTDSGYSIRSASGYYIGQGSDANGLTTGTSALVNTISLDADGNANIIGSGGAYLRYNFSSNQTRFRYYKSSTYTGQKAVALYVLTEDGVTHYTSLGSTKTIAAAVYSGASLVREYAGFTDAVTACKSGQYIKLLSDVKAELILTADLYIDLNGHSITGLLIPDTYKVYGMDSTTNSYSGDNVGYFNCTDENDAPVVPVTHFKSDVTGAVKRYMAVKSDAGYSFHRFYMGITHASVKPGTVGVGYKAIFAGDDTVKAQLGSYGFELQLSGFDAVTAMNTADSFVSGKAVSVRIENYNVADYGETALSAKVIMVLADGTEIESAPVSMSLRNMVEKMNTNSGAYTATQLAALREMLDKFSSTTDWTTENIK